MYPNLKKLLQSLAIGVISLTGTSASAQFISRVAGVDTAGHAGDSGPALHAALRCPSAVHVDGYIYIGDGGPFMQENDARVRAITPDGNIWTVIGMIGVPDSASNLADSIPSAKAKLHGTAGITTDAAGNLYIADGISSVRRVNVSDGYVRNIAGSLTTVGQSGDGGPARSALLRAPMDVAVDASGNVYIADCNNHVIRKISASSGFISTVAGRYSQGLSGDGGLAVNAQLNHPRGITIGPNGDLYIADYDNHRIRRVNFATGIISTVAGTGPGFDGDGGPATDAHLAQPARVAFDAAGNMYISDVANQRIRKVTTTGTISTFAGSGLYFTGPDGEGDGDSAKNARMVPYGLSFDECGNLYVGGVVCRIRVITPTMFTDSVLCGIKVNAVHDLASEGPKELRIAPNPSNGHFTLHMAATTTEPVELTVTDIAGRRVKEMSTTTNRDTEVYIDTPPGLYFIQAATRSGKWSAKVLIQ